MIELKNGSKLKMLWKGLVIAGSDKIICLPIEPMVIGPDILYIPENINYFNEEIEYLQNVKWNRDIEYKKVDYTPKIYSSLSQIIDYGTIESTKAAQEFMLLDMFDPDFDLTKEQVHELWCVLEKRFAESVEGKVTIASGEVVKGSVFEKISLPALVNNKKASIVFK